MAASSIKGLPPVHPGEYLKDIILPALDTTTQGFAEHLGVSRQTLYDIMNGEKAVTAQMALRLARATGVRAEMWMSLQTLYDLKRAEAELGEQLAAITRVSQIASAAGHAAGTSSAQAGGSSIAAAAGKAMGTSTAKARGAGVIQGGKSESGRFYASRPSAREVNFGTSDLPKFEARDTATGQFVPVRKGRRDPASIEREVIKHPERKR